MLMKRGSGGVAGARDVGEGVGRREEEEWWVRVEGGGG
jgi:hypothetical protein